MTRFKKLVAGLAVLLVIGLFAGWMITDQESIKLTDHVREGLGGTYIELPDGVVHYELAGPEDGEPVVLVHGFSVPAYIWDSTFSALVDSGYRVLRFDLYGRGYSDRPEAEYTMGFFASQVHELVTALEIERPFHLVGLSMGGPVVTFYANEHPQTIRTLALVAPLTVMPTEDDIAPLAMPLLGDYLAGVYFMPMLLKGQSSDFANPDRFPDWQDRFADQMQYRGFRRAIMSTVRNMPSTDLNVAYTELGKQPFPIRLFWGTEDTTVPFAHSEILLDLLPGTELEVIEGTGHVPMVESFEKFNPMLEAFLQEKQP